MTLALTLGLAAAYAGCVLVARRRRNPPLAPHDLRRPEYRTSFRNGRRLDRAL